MEIASKKAISMHIFEKGKYNDRVGVWREMEVQAVWEIRPSENTEVMTIEEYLNKRRKMQMESIDQTFAECYDTQVEELIQRR